MPVSACLADNQLTRSNNIHLKEPGLFGQIQYIIIILCIIINYRYLPIVLSRNLFL